MKEEERQNEIDQLLRERFGDHTIIPETELWENIESRMQPRIVPIHKYSRLKIALAVSAAVIAGLVFLLFVNNNQNTKPVEYSRNEPVEKTITSDDKSGGISAPAVAENGYKEEKYYSAQTSQKTEQVREKENRETPDDLYLFAEIESINPENIAAKDYSYNEFFRVPGKKMITTAPANHKKSETAGNNRGKNIRYSKTRHISAKDYYARKSGKKGLINSDNFDLKINFTPAFSFRKVKNQQNIADLDYDEAFYNETESGRFSLNGGFDLAYKINQKWSVYSGLKLSHYSQQIQNAQNKYKVISPNEVYIPSSAGYIGINGDGVGELSSQSQFETKLKLQFLDVPLIVRHYFSPGFYVDAGAKYSFFLADKTSVSLNDASANFTVAKIEGLQKHNFGVVFGTGFEQVTRSGIRFELGPEFSFNLNNLNPAADVICKPASVGLHTAIYFGRYKQL